MLQNLKRLTVAVLLATSSAATIGAAQAQDCMMGEVRLFAGNYAPQNWALANGQLLPISQNTALFSILGTTYGGDGRATFALPDLRGRVAVSAGQGSGLSPYVLGEMGGSEANTLTVSQMPMHNHPATTTSSTTTTLKASGTTANSADPTDRVLANAGNTRVYVADSAPAIAMNAAAAQSSTTSTTTVGIVGGSLPVNNIQPFETLNYIVCMYGYYPPRN